MAKLTYNWSRVSRGDIISFRYPTKDGKILRRTVLVFEPKLKNKAKNPSSDFLLHGIQLEISNRPITSMLEIIKILETVGIVGVVDADSQIYEVIIEGQTKSVYTKLKALIKKHGNFRTFNYDKVKTSQVFLEDLRFPQDFVKELIGEN